MPGTPHEAPLKADLSGVAFLSANILCWSAVPVILRYLTGSLDAWTANGVRYPLAAMMFWPTLIWARNTGALTWPTFRRCLVPSFLAFGGQIFWALAPYYLPAGAIGFFMRFSLVFALLGAMLLFADERRLLRSPLFFVGLTLTVAGFITLSISKMRWDVEVGATGIAVILLCGLFFGFYGVSVRYYLHGIKPMVSFGLVSQCVSLGTLTAMFALGDYGQLTKITSLDWMLLASSSMLGIALGHQFLYSAVARLGAAVTAGAQSATPFLTMLWAAWILSESMLAMQWLAGLAMVAGAGLLIVAQHRMLGARRRAPTATRVVGREAP